MSHGGRLSPRRLVETTAEVILAVALATAFVAVLSRAVPTAGLNVVYRRVAQIIAALEEPGVS